jgi:hypothetical protein
MNKQQKYINLIFISFWIIFTQKVLANSISSMENVLPSYSDNELLIFCIIGTIIVWVVILSISELIKIKKGK